MDRKKQNYLITQLVKGVLLEAIDTRWDDERDEQEEDERWDNEREDDEREEELFDSIRQAETETEEYIAKRRMLG